MKKSTWIPIVFALALAAAGVALFGWPGPARQFLVAQKDWVRSLGAAVAVLSAASACVVGLRRYFLRREAAAEAPEATLPEPPAPPPPIRRRRPSRSPSAAWRSAAPQRIR